MVVLRLPRSVSILKSHGHYASITPSMISSPLECNHLSDFDILPALVLPAIEYISNKLQSKSIHVTLIVGRGNPLPIDHRSEILIVPTTPLEPLTWRTLLKFVEKATKKFSLSPAWATAFRQSQNTPFHNKFLLRQSILQNEVLFSQEGLTLLNIDRIYTIKHRLHMLSRGGEVIPEQLYIKSCIQLLRKTIRGYDGRPFSMGFFCYVYDHLNFPKDLLVRVAKEYKSTHGEIGIVLLEDLKPKEKPKEKPREKPKEKRRFVAPPPARQLSRRRKRESPRPGPKTPQTASDVTPITRNEWNILRMAEKFDCRGMVTRISIASP
ncbi:hypothetical protein AJ80_06453 [Polytolypa hystricis UAMH7299]|uniref:DUF7582 domain-containing protein n=1 Tax=Polytolypa hystricis (strain UAMH7299) TaxID=1447883 RepID=A0A2B7XWD5_POLH7|nr:hypothetical protein AJ80_06453 [Polytolypa hystricis UAMH7299]